MMSQSNNVPPSIMPAQSVIMQALLLLAAAAAIVVGLMPEVAQARSSSTLASKRLMKEFREVQTSDSYKNGVFTVELVDDNIFKWHVKLYKLDPDSRIHRLLRESREKGGKDHLLLELRYNDNYPLSPPFVRVVYPHLEGTSMFGYGTICSELLSESGWNSAYTIEPLILQLAATMAEGRLYGFDFNREHTYEQAREHFDKYFSKHSLWSTSDRS
uniref:Ubiquitin-conjugating enzyme E2 Q2 n=1 Tax=Aceria tosichella TaxID=561515 RepID=A0A6G1SIF5_9ACAR